MSCGSAGPSTIISPLLTTWPSCASHVLVLRDQVLVRHAVDVGDDQTLLALGVLAERDGAGDFRQHAGILGRTRLEQFGHARQTAGNVARLRGFLRDTCQHVAHRHFLAVFHRDDGADLEGDVDQGVGARDLDFVAGFVQQFDLRTQALGGAAGLRFGSITTSVDRPVTSSICLATVTPSSTFSNRTRPAYSVMIGRVCGSQVASTAPALILSPSRRPSAVAPYGTL